MTEKEKKAATPRGRKKKEIKEEHIASIGPGSSPELVHEEIGRAADVVSVKEAPKEEGDWGTFEDRGKAVPDPMIAEGTGSVEYIAYQHEDHDVLVKDLPTKFLSPSLMGEDEQNEVPAGTDKPKGQLTLDGTPVPLAAIWIKPQAIPYEIRTEKCKLNTTEEGFTNRHMTDKSELTQWVAKKLKMLKDATVLPGDFDKHVEIIVKVIRGEIEVQKHYVGEDEDD